MRLGDISVAYVELMAKVISDAGKDPSAILAQYQLDAVRLSSPLARISIPRFMRLGHAFIESFSFPELGLAMGKRSRAPTFGLSGLLAQSAPYLGDACQALAEYELLSSFNARGRSRFTLEKGQGVLQFYSISPYNQYNYFVVDSVLASWSYFLHSLVAPQAILSHVEIEFPAPAYREHYASFFPCDVRFGAKRNALILHKTSLDRPILSACASTYAALRTLAEKELSRVRLGLSFREQVERAVGSLLNGQTPTLEQVAQHLNSTPWAVRRRLQSESVSFQQVLNETRRDLALSYVRGTALSLGEIAYLLGFGSVVAFQRAFKRWTGSAPGQYRAEQNYISTASSPSSS